MTISSNDTQVVPSEAEAINLMHSLSNHGRWGDDDEKGTLNLITPEVRRRAAELVHTGASFSLAHPLDPHPSPANPIPPVHRMLEPGDTRDYCSIDLLEIAPHGWAITHLDALGHIMFEDQMWNGRTASSHLGANGLTFASILGASGGIVTRGVLLDVAAAKGKPFLNVGDHVDAAMLKEAEAFAGTTVRAGDAVLIRTGSQARHLALGLDPTGTVPGITVNCLPWLHERDVALYGGDVADDEPSGYPRLPKPLHQIGCVAMGLSILDNLALEELAAHCQHEERYEFLLTLAPIPAPAATGSPVNPIAVL